MTRKEKPTGDTIGSIRTALIKWYLLITEKAAYSLDRWDQLSQYITDGRLNVDSNPVENSIRPVVPGRKNYLFAGSYEAANRSGMPYSLLGTCKMDNIEPYNWL